MMHDFWKVQGYQLAEYIFYVWFKAEQKKMKIGLFLTLAFSHDIGPMGRTSRLIEVGFHSQNETTTTS